MGIPCDRSCLVARTEDPKNPKNASGIPISCVGDNPRMSHPPLLLVFSVSPPTLSPRYGFWGSLASCTAMARLMPEEQCGPGGGHGVTSASRAKAFNGISTHVALGALGWGHDGVDKVGTHPGMSPRQGGQGGTPPLSCLGRWWKVGDIPGDSTKYVVDPPPLHLGALNLPPLPISGDFGDPKI